ncbi:MAG: nucleotide exchange factor GrpE [Methanomicrobiales archaeon]|nr:nucleotide exchange factor GrpE [Methanomicrobiales archaeon]
MEEKTEQTTRNTTAGPEQESGFTPPDEAVTGIDELQRSYDELNDRFLRLAADFENYKKRVARDIDARASSAVEQFAVEILDIVDNLERALASDDERLREGLEQIHKLLTSILERRGIEPLSCINTPFDPVRQEAIAYVPSECEEGIVIDEVRRGYRMHDKVLRCAKVAVSQGKKKEE